MASFTVSIDQFEGPLDLMLHLVKEKELDLFDLDLNVLADQYIQYINSMEQMHLEIASEYLIELAGLIEYKSRKLLPKDTSELEDTYEEDTKEQLMQRLLEYQRFKEVTAKFSELSNERMLHYDKPQSEIANQWLKESKLQIQDIHGNPIDLIKAMNHCIRRYKIMQPLQMKVAKKELSVEERTIQIKARMTQLPEVFEFFDLCIEQDLHLLIVTFLSVLDLLRLGYLDCELQGEQIWLKKGARYGS
ncbi:MAG: segregation/condensation protein A [Erysipelotrichaceae bacterium]|nr:segregation/condensation protein A [Erysipelotrichaceae bacterium]